MVKANPDLASRETFLTQAYNYTAIGRLNTIQPDGQLGIFTGDGNSIFPNSPTEQGQAIKAFADLEDSSYDNDQDQLGAMVKPITRALIAGSGHEAEVDGITTYQQALNLIEQYYTALSPEARLALAETYQLDVPDSKVCEEVPVVGSKSLKLDTPRAVREWGRVRALRRENVVEGR